MSEWRRTAKIVFATAGVTSVVWLTIGAVLMQRGPPPAPPSPAGAQTAPREVAARAAVSARSPREVRLPAGKLLIPVEGVRVAELVDTFTQARAGGARVHDAIDIMAPIGTPVIAAAPGKVEKLFFSRQGGNTVYVRSPDGTLIYYYAHLDRYAPGLAEGQMLRLGQPIGTVGYSGNANPAGPHLHFAIQQTTPQAKWWEPSTALNPYPLLRGR